MTSRRSALGVALAAALLPLAA
ncbi:MAG: hypothetical protein JWP65_1057, partial [Ramlibacter sp.]|nr:hypothetical protein [Ramlibacter sp.]